MISYIVSKVNNYIADFFNILNMANVTNIQKIEDSFVYIDGLAFTLVVDRYFCRF